MFIQSKEFFKNMDILEYTPKLPEMGYTNKILWVNLGKESSAEIQDVTEKMRMLYQGGRGYAIKLLYDHTDETTDPMGPENLLIISRGPMTGEYRWPGGTKTVISALSPTTNGYGEASVGGAAGQHMKFSGFDTLCVKGELESPKILVVDGINGKIQLEEDPGTEDALQLGQDLIEKYGRDVTGVYTLGIAGRKQVRFACINGIAFNGKYFIPRQAGRTGMGTVMGKKGLIAVVFIGKVDKHTKVSDRDALMQAGRAMRKVIAKNDKQQLDMFTKGTSGLVELEIGRAHV